MGYLGRKISWQHLFLFDSRKGQVQVKLAKISKSKCYCKRIPYLFSFVSGFQRCHYFYIGQKCQKLRSKKVTSLSLPLLPLHSKKKKILLRTHCWLFSTPGCLAAWLCRCLLDWQCPPGNSMHSLPLGALLAVWSLPGWFGTFLILRWLLTARCYSEATQCHPAHVDSTPLWLLAFS